MIRIKEAIIVEGRYDKARVASIFDTMIIETDGFRIFSDKGLQRFICDRAKEQGIVVLTDTDSAGFRIRSFITSLTENKNVFHALVPDIYGKEGRKEKPSKEGKLGIEGIDNEVIINAVLSSGITVNNENYSGYIFSAADMVELGISGGKYSAEIRRALLSRLSLPQRTSTKMLIKYLSGKYSKAEIIEMINQIIM